MRKKEKDQSGQKTKKANEEGLYFSSMRKKVQIDRGGGVREGTGKFPGEVGVTGRTHGNLKIEKN